MAMTGGSTAAQRADLDATRAMSDILSAGVYGQLDLDKEAGVRELASVVDKYLASAYTTLQCGEQSDAARPLHTPRHRMEWYAVIYNACNGDPLRSRALYVQLALSVVNILEHCALYPLLQRCIEPSALTIEPAGHTTSHEEGEEEGAMSATEHKGSSKIRSLRNSSFNLVKKLLLMRREGNHGGSPTLPNPSTNVCDHNSIRGSAHTGHHAWASVERSRSESNASARSSLSSTRTSSSRAPARSCANTPRVTVSLPCTPLQRAVRHASQQQQQQQQQEEGSTISSAVHATSGAYDTMADTSLSLRTRHCHSESCCACDTARRTTITAAPTVVPERRGGRLEADEREMAERVRREETEGQLSMSSMVLLPSTNNNNNDDNDDNNSSTLAAASPAVRPVMPAPSVKVLRAFQEERQVFLAFRRVVLSCFSYLDQYYTRRFGMDTIAMLCVKLFYVVLYEPLRPLLQRETALLVHYLRQRQDGVMTYTAPASNNNNVSVGVVSDKEDAERVRLVRESLHTRQDLLAAMTATASYLVMDAAASSANSSNSYSYIVSGNASVEQEVGRTGTAPGGRVPRQPETSRGPQSSHASNAPSGRVRPEVRRQTSAGSPPPASSSSFLRATTSSARGAAAVAVAVAVASFSSYSSSAPPAAAATTSSSASSSSSSQRSSAHASGEEEDECGESENTQQIDIQLQGVAELRARLESDQLPRCLLTQSARYIAMSQHGTNAGPVSETIPAGLQRSAAAHGESAATAAASALPGAANASLGARKGGAVGTIVRDVHQCFEELLLQDYGTHYLAALDVFYSKAVTRRVQGAGKSQGGAARMSYLGWVCAVMRLERRLLGAEQPSFLRKRVHDTLVRRLLTQPHRALILDERCGFRAWLELWDGGTRNAAGLVSAMTEVDPELIHFSPNCHHHTASSTSILSATNGGAGDAATQAQGHRRNDSTASANASPMVSPSGEQTPADDLAVLTTVDARVVGAIAKYVAVFVATQEDSCLLLLASILAAKVIRDAAAKLTDYFVALERLWREEQGTQQDFTMSASAFAHARAARRAALTASFMRDFVLLFARYGHLLRHAMQDHPVFINAFTDAVREVVNSSRWSSAGALAASARRARWAGMLGTNQLPSVLLSRDAGARAMAPLEALATCIAASATNNVGTRSNAANAGSNTNSSDGESYVVVESISLPRLFAEYGDRLVRQLIAACDANERDGGEARQSTVAGQVSATANNSEAQQQQEQEQQQEQRRECVALLSYLTQLVPFLDHTELFVEQYRRRLVRRLIEYGAQSPDRAAQDSLHTYLMLEQGVLVQLEQQLGPSTTHRLRAMVHDCLESTTTQRGFDEERQGEGNDDRGQALVQYVPHNSRGVANDVPGFKVYVLTATHWPLCAPPRELPVVMPASWQRGMRAYAAYYKRLHPSRMLRWLGAHAAAVLQADFLAGRKELTVNVYQAAILLALSEAQCVQHEAKADEPQAHDESNAANASCMMSCEELARRTGLSVRALQSHVRSLLHLTQPHALLVCRANKAGGQQQQQQQQQLSSMSSSSALTSEKSSSSNNNNNSSNGDYYAINADFAHKAAKLRLCSPSYAAQAFLSGLRGSDLTRDDAGHTQAGTSTCEAQAGRVGAVQDATAASAAGHAHGRTASHASSAKATAGGERKAAGGNDATGAVRAGGGEARGGSVQYGVHASRRVRLEAVVMRCMKQHRTLAAPELLRLVNRSLCSGPSSPSSSCTSDGGVMSGACVRGTLAAVSSRELKLRVEELIDRDYLRRSEADDNVLEYIP